MVISKKTNFPRFERGSNIFQGGGGGGGGPIFSSGGGPNANYYRNPYNLLFSRGGGSGPPIPPLGSMHARLSAAFSGYLVCRQTMWTLIRLLLEEQSDLGPRCLLQRWLTTLSHD